MEQGLAQLKPIEGLDTISFWPLAVGWWVVIALLISLLLVIALLFRRRRKILHSWQHGTLTQLDTLENTVKPENSLTVAIQLSELMRRIATFQYSREECAGLDGKDWLHWLKTHDPNSFDWEHKSAWLADAAYAPSDTQIPVEEIKEVIITIKRWMK